MEVLITANQKVYVQMDRTEYLLRHRLYEPEELLYRQYFLRISNSEIVNIRKIQDIDLSVTGRICIRFREEFTRFLGSFCSYGTLLPLIRCAVESPSP